MGLVANYTRFASDQGSFPFPPTEVGVPELASGHSFAGYRIDSLIGRGGMGDVSRPSSRTGVDPS
jgi:hypothetical protein